MLPFQDTRVHQAEQIVERGQTRPVNWPKAASPLAFRESDIATPKDAWTWKRLASVHDLAPNDSGTTYGPPPPLPPPPIIDVLTVTAHLQRGSRPLRGLPARALPRPQPAYAW